ncbi:MAG: hypothetical protein ACK4SY_02475 [Pyrobaculum sp.]
MPYLISASLEIVREVLSGARRHLVRPLFDIRPGELAYLAAGRKVYGRFYAGIVFIAPRENLGDLLQKLGEPPTAARSRHVVIIEVTNLTPCRKQVELRRSAVIKRLDEREVEELESSCGLSGV